jgi:hypothetical protein
VAVGGEVPLTEIAAISLSSVGEKAIVALLAALFSSVLLWVVGKRVAYHWDERKRLREGDLAALATFYKLYGDFFAAWKLWNSHKKQSVGAVSDREVQWNVLRQVEIAEGGFEALLVKLASERRLESPDQRLLGSFREAYQMLRECVRNDQPLAWWASDKPSHAEGFRQYRAYKALAEYVALRLESPRKAKVDKPSDADAIRALLRITDAQAFRDSWWMIAEQELDLLQIMKPEGDGARESQSSVPRASCSSR